MAYDSLPKNVPDCDEGFIYYKCGWGSGNILYGSGGVPVRGGSGRILYGDAKLCTACADDPTYPWGPEDPVEPVNPGPVAPVNPIPGPVPVTPPYNPPDPDDPNPPHPEPSTPDDPSDNPPESEWGSVTLTWKWDWAGDDGAIDATLSPYSQYDCYGHAKSHIIGMAFSFKKGQSSGTTVTGSFNANGSGELNGPVSISVTGTMFGKSITRSGTGSLTVNIMVNWASKTWSM